MNLQWGKASRYLTHQAGDFQTSEKYDFHGSIGLQPPLTFSSFPPQEELASNFSLQHHHRIKHEGHENKGNDHLQVKLLIVSQILLVST